MTWLLFMDESGHDHKNMPFEVRGGVALHTSKVWPFVCDFQQMEVDSEMSVAVQAADICLYCINWGFRVRNWNFTGRTRDEIHRDFGGRVRKLQFNGDGYNADGEVYPTRGIIYVPDPYMARERNE